ncbi:ABC transporter substrate-binding protein [Streptomyces bacillaris]|uniref:ABC transporter substrate-binding protein n=1 Tax=Streptomyces cavourensis TaxID=67258 RepID=A0AAD0Q1B9_9ACTN|nr:MULTISPECIES: ABC transporter substrate-binding protein [Streptomyces]AXI70122.1 ABC transporter substrate-binding protein [Streptomyces cavourensis]MBH0245046.1 ABC transporter substrate-binding protein [Streptomyces cavourensis]NUV40751.1 ABC transporter substrate-binding protein [Streptomyces sp. CAI-24]NUV79294.1 ABC transporter substrate-binding protein [Streptomyces sp. CAI-155]SCD27739.1 iron complex transport system substrate-binding protein [Streptomyces sp. DvalAA-19]
MLPQATPAPIRTAALLAAAAVLLTACGGGTTTSSAEGGDRADGFPLTLKNCGRTVTVKAPPQRAVSVDQGSTEILLSLGLADRLAGTATWSDPVMKGLEKANAGVERISENRPSSEKVLDKEPDFLSASFASTLAKGGVAPREQFEKLGVPTYISPADCIGKDNSGGGDGARTAPLTMDSVYTEVRELSQVFGVPERGDALVKKLQERVAKATEGIDGSKASLLYWFSDSKAPYLAGCCGAPGVITRELGAKNVFDDTHDEWPQISWETVADRNPDVLVIGDLSRTMQTAESAEKKIEFLESNPVTKTMDAVKNRRYVLLSGQAMNPTIRTVEGLERVAAGLRDFGLAG